MILVRSGTFAGFTIDNRRVFVVEDAGAVAKIAGTSVRENWIPVLNQGETEASAIELIIKASATDPQLCGLLKLDQSALNRLAKALKTAMRVPGYTAKDAPTLAGARK